MGILHEILGVVISMAGCYIDWLYEQFDVKLLILKKGKNMNTEDQEFETTKKPARAKSILTGLVVGGLVGAGTMLLLAPQPGAKTRTEIKQGAIHLRDQTSEAVKGKVTQVKSKANQIKADMQVKVENWQHQGQDLLVRQLDRVSHAAEAGKKALQDSHEHTVV